jgi:hypothetical protein
MTPSTRSRTALALLLLVTLLAGALRLRHIGFGLPMAAEPDCRIPFQVENLREGGGWPRSDKELTWYPLVCARIAALFPVADEVPAGAPLSAHLERAARPYVDTRTACALLALAVVPLAYVLALRFVTPLWALLAATLAATNLLHVGFSQQSRPHAAAAATFLLAMLALLHLRRSGRLVHWIGAGLALALAIGTLQSGIALLLPLVTVAVLRKRAGGRLLDWRALPALALLAASLPYFYPFWFGEERATFGSQGKVFMLAAHPIFLKEFTGRGFFILARTLWFYDPVMLLLVVTGLCVFARAVWMRRSRVPPPDARDRRADLLVVLSFVLPYVFVVGIYQHVYERFLLPLLPYLACVSAWGLACLWDRSRATVARTLVALGVLLGVLAPAYGAWRLIEVRGAPTTNEVAGRWLEEHLDLANANVVLTPSLDMPLARHAEGLLVNGTPPSRRSKYYWARYQIELELQRRPQPQWKLDWLRVGSLAELQELEREPLEVLARKGADYAVIEVFAMGRNLPVATLLRSALQQGAERVARITPDGRDDYSENPFGYEDMAHVPPEHFLLRTLQAQRTGPVIEIYRLGGDGERPPR